MEKYNFCFNCLPIRIFVLFLAITVEIMSNIGRSTLELQNSYHLTLKILTQGHENCTKVSSPWVLPSHQNFVILAITGAEISGGGGGKSTPWTDLA